MDQPNEEIGSKSYFDNKKGGPESGLNVTNYFKIYCWQENLAGDSKI